MISKTFSGFVMLSAFHTHVNQIPFGKEVVESRQLLSLLFPQKESKNYEPLKINEKQPEAK